MKKTNNYIYSVQDLCNNLSLNKLKQLIEPFRDMKMLVGITCHPELMDFLTKDIPLKKDNSILEKDSFYKGVPIYKINNQKEPIKYFYNDKELNEYLKNNK
jgi:hypothetical protein